jgi:hypothetical protein
LAICEVEAAGALHANPSDLAVWAEPTQQLPVAAPISREVPVTEQPSLLIQHGSVMGATVGVDPADDNPAVDSACRGGLPLDDRAGQARTGRAGGHTSDKAWSRKLVQVTRARPAEPVNISETPSRVVY